MKVIINKIQIQNLKAGEKVALGIWGPTYEMKEIFKDRGYKFKEFPMAKNLCQELGYPGKTLVKGWVKFFDNNAERDKERTFFENNYI